MMIPSDVRRRSFFRSMRGVLAASVIILVHAVRAQAEFKVTDGDIRITTTTGSRGIIFQDGTKQTTVASASGVSVSSVIYNFGSLSSVETFLSKCVGGSTVTITLASSADVHLRFYGSMTGNAGTTYRVGYLRDGNYGTGQSSSKGLVNLGNQPLQAQSKYDWFDIIEDETTGTHSYCITVASDGAATTVTFPYNSNEQARFAAYSVP